jgi:hypothetical protein
MFWFIFELSFVPLMIIQRWIDTWVWDQNHWGGGVRNLLAVAPKPVISPVGSMGSIWFLSLWTNLRRTRLASNLQHPNMKQTITFWLQTLDTYFFYAEIQALVSRWNKYLNLDGDYLKFLASECLLAHFLILCILDKFNSA